ncbi:MAG: hypothetical protein IPM75_10430 [Candidatus Competibacteraceae bacterium]|nr:hypothetical protein [Candidatus Competibacteraceae bacterium]
MKTVWRRRTSAGGELKDPKTRLQASPFSPPPAAGLTLLEIRGAHAQSFTVECLVPEDTRSSDGKKAGVEDR